MQQKADNVLPTPQRGKGIIPSDKQAIIQDAIDRIQVGHTLREIAASHGIHYKTLQGWMLALGDEYSTIRQAYIDQQLIEASDQLDSMGEVISTADPQDIPRTRVLLDLAKTQLSRAQWLAERRDRARYGQQPTAHAGGDVQVTIQIGSVTPAGVTIEHGE